ncbi:MAG: HDIG domain-containing protein [Ruminococcaceae bacterium]|nr:HDIG domain-containing protein [Oscillospiraceae bacterium]
MKQSARLRVLLYALAAVFLLAVVLFAIYNGSMPEKYLLRPGDISPYDIVAPRSIRDHVETERRAARAVSEVGDVALRSEEISSAVMERVSLFFSLIGQERDNPPLITPAPSPTPQPTAQPTPATQETETTLPVLPTEPLLPKVDTAVLADRISWLINREMGLVVSAGDAQTFAETTSDRLDRLAGHVRSLAELIMADGVDQTSLRNSISVNVTDLGDRLSYNLEDSAVIERVLALLLEPNVVYDMVATENARRAARERVLNNPVMIEKGVRIVSIDDVITDDTYQLLQELNLIDSGRFDLPHLGGIMLLMLLVCGLAAFYVLHYEKENINSMRDAVALLLALLIPLFVSAYITRHAPLSPPVYFAAVLIAAYFGFRSAIILSLCLTALILPMTNFNPIFLAVAMIGSLVAALFARGIIRKDNYAFIILVTSGTNFLTALAFSVIQKDSWTDMLLNSGFTAISGALSVIAAIGLMPLFEMLFNSVSPLRLIELSQPGHPLLRRLFIEAPGSSQHSMMVANLSDSAAAAIGANALLARVGAYYHDIGKLENPLMFTENQEGENPHDQLPPDKSADIILSHPDAGVRIGRRYRLPTPILRIIHEHHGSTAQVYFLHKAKQLAENGATYDTDPGRYSYQCPIPSSRESAIVMLADSVEAAMKSTGTNTITEAEKLIRRVIKTKNEQDQLIASGLSFHDVELIIKAFVQVFTGHFHERVKYPDENPVRQPAK